MSIEALAGRYRAIYTENTVRTAVRAGALPGEAFELYGKF